MIRVRTPLQTALIGFAGGLVAAWLIVGEHHLALLIIAAVALLVGLLLMLDRR